MTKRLELLAPAKNAEQGIAAIDHGADAVYIGAPLFGARAAAGNSLADIEQLVRHAHLFGSKVFATVNTLLFDDELEDARKLIYQLYDIGTDAVIVQDLGLLELDLPPIELHASTQTHNYDPRRIKFLEQAGFKRIILARETSLEQMKALRKETNAELEAFVQGALCVCYSGQCYMSLYLNGRSGNRGTCTQPCRSSYDLVNSEGKVLRQNEHLLSLKDFSAAQHIESMIDAGITSFKMEGRLKDLVYVKNTTAYYRKLIDDIIATHEDLRASSSGKTHFFFEPDTERTFNRGFTDYFLVKRQPIASRATQKSIGKPIGNVIKSEGNKIDIKTTLKLTAGDGICYFDDNCRLDGFLVNGENGNKVTANKELNLKKGTPLWRNNDYAFEKQLQGKTAERKIAVSMTLEETATGFMLTLVDEDGCKASVSSCCPKEPAKDAARATETIEKQLSKLGGTAFVTKRPELITTQAYFLPAALLNDMRRKAVEELQTARMEHFSPQDTPHTPNDIPYFEETLDQRANITNTKTEEFYRRHGVTHMEPGPDLEQRNTTQVKEDTPLMTCKYCLRFELGQCLMHKNNKNVSPEFRSELFLLNNGNRFHLTFDCKRCEMQVFAKKKTH